MHMFKYFVIYFIFTKQTLVNNLTNTTAIGNHINEISLMYTPNPDVLSTHENSNFWRDVSIKDSEKILNKSVSKFKNSNKDNQEHEKVVIATKELFEKGETDLVIRNQDKNQYTRKLISCQSCSSDDKEEVKGLKFVQEKRSHDFQSEKDQARQEETEESPETKKMRDYTVYDLISIQDKIFDGIINQNFCYFSYEIAKEKQYNKKMLENEIIYGILILDQENCSSQKSFCRVLTKPAIFGLSDEDKIKLKNDYDCCDIDFNLHNQNRDFKIPKELDIERICLNSESNKLNIDPETSESPEIQESRNQFYDFIKIYTKVLNSVLFDTDHMYIFRVNLQKNFILIAIQSNNGDEIVENYKEILPLHLKAIFPIIRYNERHREDRKPGRFDIRYKVQFFSNTPTENL